MRLPNSWVPFINRTSTKYRLLFTIGKGILSDIKTNTHPGTWGRVVRASTHAETFPEDRDGNSYPYWPLIAEWPDITYEYEIEKRRVAEVSVSFNLLKTIETNNFFSSIEKNTQGWVRVDLWVPGVPLEDSIRLFAGPITDINRQFAELSYTISASDYFDGDNPEFPLGNPTLDSGEFPEIPAELDGVAKRKYLLGPNPNLLPVIPISNDGLEYYICEPWMAPYPNRFFVGSNEITDQAPSVVQARTEITRSPYMKLVLQRRPEIEGFSGQVFVQGGSGPTTEDAISFFLQRIKNLKLTQRAKSHIKAIDRDNTYDYYVVIGSTGKVDEILSQRLFPQSNLIPFYRGGLFDTIKENDLSRQHTFTLGSNLLYRLPGDRDRTSDDDVYNAIEVKFSRKLFSTEEGIFSRNTELVDKAYGGKLGNVLARSEQIYGRKLLRVEAADLYRRLDARRLGYNLAQILHTVHKRWTYLVPWKNAFFVDINDRGLLTDPDLGISNVKVRVSKLTMRVHGVEMTLQTVDF